MRNRRWVTCHLLALLAIAGTASLARSSDDPKPAGGMTTYSGRLKTFTHGRVKKPSSSDPNKMETRFILQSKTAVVTVDATGAKWLKDGEPISIDLVPDTLTAAPKGTVTATGKMKGKVFVATEVHVRFVNVDGQ